MGKWTGYRKVLLCSAFLGVMTLGTVAQAQVLANFDNNVMVDLSVLDDRGVRAASPSGVNPYVSTKMPPAQMPRSQFYGLPQGVQSRASVSLIEPNVPAEGMPPKSRLLVQAPDLGEKPMLKMPDASTSKITLKKPIAAPKVPVTRVAVAETAPKPMAKVVTKPEVVEPVAAKEVVEVKLPTQVVEPVSKEIAQAETNVETVKVAEPKPIVEKTKVAEAPKVEPKPQPAPETVMAEAPPPPPSTAIEPKEVTSAISTESENKTTTASLPTQSEAAIRVVFQSGRSKLPSSVETDLKKMAEDLRSHPDDRVQLQAYAGGEDLSASKARRLSLSRALAVRSYLIDQGVQSTRIDVRALGNKTTEEPFDRVDVEITPR
ncbi:MAG: OmpA family protein [Terasakiella sp.]|uniref:OmpA family protein n=1 Tax=unclassified Terasakiella TaxID=2614952 RepID=UPI003B00F896